LYLKIAASAAQLANCILLHSYSRTDAAPIGCENSNKNLRLFNKLA